MKASADILWQDLNSPAGPTSLKLATPALQSVYLHPGQLFVTSEPAVVTTILGSCVAVCLWEPALGVGGINHYLLPTGVRTAATGLRYGNVAIEHLLERLQRAGARQECLQAKVFGGACVLEAMRGKENHLGAKNVDIARLALQDAGIPVMSSDVGGGRGRKLIFYPHDGNALVKLL